VIGSPDRASLVAIRARGDWPDGRLFHLAGQASFKAGAVCFAGYPFLFFEQ